MDMKTTQASTFIQVVCSCPYCGAVLDILDKDSVKEALGNELRSDSCGIETTCEECNLTFIVDRIDY